MDDFIAIVTSFCGRIYGSQGKKKTKQIVEELKEECQNDKK